VVVLKKVWAFLKTYWYVPVLIIVAIVLKSKSKSVEEVLEVARDYNKKQLDANDNAEKEKKESRQVIEAEYENAIKEIEADYAKKNKVLDVHHKNYVKAVIKNWSDDPDQMAERISLKFGFHYVPKTNDSDTD